MEDLILYIVKNLVDHPEDVAVRATQKEEETVYVLTVNPSDMGKVIGRQGRIAKAIRTIVKSTALRFGSQKVNIDISD